jgi:molecular chaperone GrpE
MIKVKGKGAQKPTDKEVELKNQLARALADYDNLRKRTEKEKEDIIKFSNLNFFLELTPIIDNLKKAQLHLKDEGLENVIRELARVIAGEGMENIEVQEGSRYDENFHEVVEVVNTIDDEKEGIISEVVLEGWKFKDGFVIRPAKVKVYKVEKGD